MAITSDASAAAVSIVLPVLNEARDIGRLLGEIRQQAPPPGGFEVLVADGGSTDETRAIVRAAAESWPQLRLIDNPRRLSSAGRNVGARAARGKYVLFVDGHCTLPAKDYLVRLVELFESTGAACLSRPQPLDRLGDNPWARAISAARHSRLGHNPSSDIYGGAPGFTDPRSAGAAYRREVIQNLGGYDERFDACEDVEFNHRVAEAGLRAYRHPELSVPYRPRASLRGLFVQMMRYGRGRARLMARHRGLISPPLVTLAASPILALAALALCGPRITGWLIGGVAAGYALVVMAESARLGRGVAAALRCAAAFVSIHLGLVLGFWRGLPDYSRFRMPMEEKAQEEGPPTTR